jgi:hypothetical protein
MGLDTIQRIAKQPRISPSIACKFVADISSAAEHEDLGSDGCRGFLEVASTGFLEVAYKGFRVTLVGTFLGILVRTRREDSLVSLDSDDRTRGRFLLRRGRQGTRATYLRADRLAISNRLYGNVELHRMPVLILAIVWFLSETLLVVGGEDGIWTSFHVQQHIHLR